MGWNIRREIPRMNHLLMFWRHTSVTNRKDNIVLLSIVNVCSDLLVALSLQYSKIGRKHMANAEGLNFPKTSIVTIIISIENCQFKKSKILYSRKYYLLLSARAKKRMPGQRKWRNLQYVREGFYVMILCFNIIPSYQGISKPANSKKNQPKISIY